MQDLTEAALIQTTLTIPKKLYQELRDKAKADNFNVNDAMCSLIYNYVNDVYRK